MALQVLNLMTFEDGELRPYNVGYGRLQREKEVVDQLIQGDVQMRTKESKVLSD